jgi:quinol monooxygenase YgiN
MTARRVIVAGWYTVAPSKRDQVLASFKDLIARARNATGCLDVAISADTIDPARINIFELWASQRDLNAWRKIAKAPRRVAKFTVIDVQKHEIISSGPPF